MMFLDILERKYYQFIVEYDFQLLDLCIQNLNSADIDILCCNEI